MKSQRTLCFVQLKIYFLEEISAMTTRRTSLKNILTAGVFTVTTTALQAEPQPNMRKALASLKEAQTALKNATADKGGHRAKAMTLIADAISEVQKGIKFDNAH